ncbi:hypothetical protein [Microbacterium sp.]|uniref:hypothetical protein n=1 Tax=Microbacterium sp. TaxID=51671 RepID=UPI0025D0FAD9|nr:hypothetical protein [Microbacterium sp.]
MRVRAAAIVLAGVMGLAGCSQVAAIAPVGGDHLAEVRYAAIDVLLAEKTAILVAPVCVQASSGEVTCAGETMDGGDIMVVSPGDDQAVVSVTVGDRELYSGSIIDVLNNAARNG